MMGIQTENQVYLYLWECDASNIQGFCNYNSWNQL
jgi:hypothetical protein